ncbi:MAG: transporter substrate-binding domain-containing protein [Clostridia bacterium]|nr:transporter substrate-binding domain-containing protein [Clostridia bacterium]
MKKLISFVVALMMVCSMVPALSEKLVVSTEATFPPYEFVDGDDYAGIDIEIADAIAKKLGYEGIEVMDIAFDNVIPSVTEGKADMAMAGLTATADRMNNVYFSFPYATGIQVIIVKEDSPIKTVDDLFEANPVIGVQIATTGDIYAGWDFEDEGLGKVSRFNTGVDAVEALKNGKIDCVMIDSEPAKAFVAANEGLKILETAYAEEDYAIAIDKNNVELLGKVTAALQDLIADGTVQKIIDKYIPAN